MNPMRYALSASERAFKEAVREFAGRAVAGSGDGRTLGPDFSGYLCRDLEKWLSMFRPTGLSRVEEAVALEEIVRRFPKSGPKLIASRLFGALSPGLCRAAADLGAAQGILAPDLAGFVTPRGPGRAVLQGLADALTRIEAVRLRLYRAAILEDAGRGDTEESDEAGRLAAALILEALDMNERIKTGGEDETGNTVREGGRDGNRQRPEGRRGDPQAPRG
jgi:hypothetical protein